VGDPHQADRLLAVGQGDLPGGRVLGRQRVDAGDAHRTIEPDLDLGAIEVHHEPARGQLPAEILRRVDAVEPVTGGLPGVVGDVGDVPRHVGLLSSGVGPGPVVGPCAGRRRHQHGGEQCPTHDLPHVHPLDVDAGGRAP
jgi:hypothetical protein